MSELTAQLAQLDIESIEVVLSSTKEELSLEDLMAKDIASGALSPDDDIHSFSCCCGCGCGSS